jgi:hypothetical protein
MKWVTREDAILDRVACAWLIRRFVDRDAEFVFVPRDQVLVTAAATGATPFDLRGVELGHSDGNCTFENIVRHYGLDADPAIGLLTRVVHGADVEAESDATPESPGLRAVARGFHQLCGLDDGRKLELQFPVYDALYAWAREVTAPAPA